MIYLAVKRAHPFTPFVEKTIENIATNGVGYSSEITMTSWLDNSQEGLESHLQKLNRRVRFGSALMVGPATVDMNIYEVIKVLKRQYLPLQSTIIK